MAGVIRNELEAPTSGTRLAINSRRTRDFSMRNAYMTPVLNAVPKLRHVGLSDAAKNDTLPRLPTVRGGMRRA